MKKSVVSKLMLVLLVGALVLTGCSTEGSNSGDEGEKYVIGISQLVEHPALDDARKGFEDGLKELGVDAEIVYQNAQGEIPNTVSIAQKYVGDEVDLIYAIATNAALSAKQATEDIPILFSAVTDPVQSEIVADWDNVGGNVTGTSDQAPTESQLKMFKQLDPSIETIGIIYSLDESNSEIQIAEVEELAPKEGLEVIKMGITATADIAPTLDVLLSKVDAVYILSDNVIAKSVELVSNKLIEYNKISVSAEETQVRGGILITNGLNYYELGKETARMAKEILVDGKDISTIPVFIAEETITTVNKNTLEALGLDENIDLIKEATLVSE